MDGFALLEEFASVRSGSAVQRNAQEARAVMVGNLDGSGRLPGDLASVGSPRGGTEARLQPGDIVISLRGATNYAAVIQARDLDEGPLFATLDLAVVRLSDAAQIDPDYVVTILNLPSTQQSLSIHRSGTAALRLPLDPLRELGFAVPPLAQQQMIVALADASAKDRHLSRRLTELRTVLINELLRRVVAAKGGIHLGQAQLRSASLQGDPV